MERIDNIQKWVEGQMMRGRYIFTREDVDNLALPQLGTSMNVSISRLVKRGLIVSPWSRFYVAVPTEYRLDGNVPPSFYIDQLMRHLGRDYYVSLLSAAAIHGAGHQRAMVFQVTANGAPLRSVVRSGTKIDFTLRQQLPAAYIERVKTRTGYMNVSSVELTALDIVSQEEKIGGLSRAAEILTELSERMHWDESKTSLLEAFSTPVVQRLGYLLDSIDEHQLAGELLLLSGRVGKTFRRVALKLSKPTTPDMTLDRKWKIIVNQEIDTDII